MRKSARAAALAAAVALVLTGCGGSEESDDAKQDTESSAPAESDGDDGADSADGENANDEQSGGDGGGDAVTREVTLEVSGDGKVVGGVTYMLEAMKTEQLDELPWTKTAELPLRGAEVKVGRAVTLTPPSMQDTSGRLVPAKCVIKVDGKTVADNADDDGGGTSCQATVK